MILKGISFSLCIIVLFSLLMAITGTTSAQHDTKPFTTATPALGTIKGRVTNAVTNTSIAGATISTNTGLSATANFLGIYSIANVPSGNNTVTASANGFVSASEDVTVAEGETVTLNFKLEPLVTPTPTPVPTTGTVFGVVRDAVTNAGIAGATVTVDSGQSDQTNSIGIYQISEVPAGDHTVTATAEGHASVSQTVTVKGGEAVRADFSLPTGTPTPTPSPTPPCVAVAIEANPSELEIPRKQSDTVTVTVTGDGGCPVAGQTIKAKISSTSKNRIKVEPKEQPTGPDGTATFTISAKNEVGNAKAKFKAGDLKAAKVKVKVVK